MCAKQHHIWKNNICRQNTAFKFGIDFGIIGQRRENELQDQSSEETPAWWTSLLFILNITYVLLLFLVCFSSYIRSQWYENKNFITWWVISQEEPGAGLPLPTYLPAVMRQVQLVSGKFDEIILFSGAEWMCLLLRWKLWCAMSAVRACASCTGSPGGSGLCFTCVPVMF